MLKLAKAIASIGGAQVANLALGMVAAKILALVLGPAGTGFYSLLRQLHDLLSGWAALGSGTGLVQGLSTRQGDGRAGFLGTGLWLCFGGVAVAALAVVLVPTPIASIVYDSETSATIAAVRWLAGTTLLGVLANVLASLISAHLGFGRLAVAQILASLALAVVAWPVANLAQDAPEALLLLIVLPLAVQIIALALAGRQLGIDRELAQAWRRFDSQAMRHFAGFIAFGLAQLALGSASGILVRAMIVHEAGLEAAGHFQAAWTLGMQNLTLLLAPFAAYAVPTLGRLRDDSSAYRQAWLNMGTVIVAAAIPAVTLAVALKPLIIRILFAEEFLAGIPVLQWMLLANLAKALSWLWAVPFLVAGRLRLFLALEALWHAIFVGGVYAGVAWLHEPGFAGVAFFAAYAIYAPATAIVCARAYRLFLSLRLGASAAAGMCLIAAIAAKTWKQSDTDWLAALIGAIAAGLLAVATLDRLRRDKLWRLLGIRR